MSNKLSLLRNMAWNWAGMICDAAAAFLVMPFLIHRLGESRYGTWILIGSLSSYFGMLDLGVRGSVGRFVAFHKARDDRAALNSTVSTAFVIACTAGFLALIASLGLPALFTRVFEIPADQIDVVRISLLLIGLNIALSFPLSLFDGVLWGFQRFDVLNAIDVPMSVLRAVLTFVVIGCGYGIIGLATITVLLALTSGLAKAVMSFRQESRLRIRWAHVSRVSAVELVSYGVSNLLINVARMIRGEVSPGLIGSLVGLPAVTFYAVSKRLIDYTERAIYAAIGVVTPLTASLHASGEHDRQRRLFLIGGRYCLTLTLFFVGGLILFGRSLISLWLGTRMSEAATLLTILALGELVPLSQCVSGTVLLGMARHRVIAWLGFAEIGLGVMLAFLLVREHGLVGVCISIAVSGAVCRGFAVLVSTCRLLSVPLAEYTCAVILPPLTMAAIVWVGTALVTGMIPSSSWYLFLGQTGLYASVYAAGALVIVSPEHRGFLVGGLKRRLFPA